MRSRGFVDGYNFFFKQKTAYVVRISDWSSDVCSSDLRKFSALAIRQALDKRDNGTYEKRRAAYKLLCKLAGHATPEGAIMLAPDPTKNTVHCGPYLETNTLHAVISEAALTAVQAAGEFRTLIKPDGVELLAVRLSFMHAEADW